MEKENEFAKIFCVEGYQILYVKDFEQAENRIDEDIEKVKISCFFHGVNIQTSISFGNEEARNKYFDACNEESARTIFEKIIKPIIYNNDNRNRTNDRRRTRRI